MKNSVKLDFTGIEALVRKLGEVGGDTKSAVDEALKFADDKIQSDTDAAMASAHLPAGGTYSTGRTRQEIMERRPATWEHDEAWVPIGFDFSKPGAGGWLISGTPRMLPDKELHRMYKQKRYMAGVQKEISEMILNRIVKEMER